MKNTNCECMINIILIIIIISLAITNNKEIKNIGQKITDGYMNNLIIIIIIALTTSENMKIGLYLTIIYLFLLIKYNKNFKKFTNFKSQHGYSPLNCKTYGNSKKKTGSTFYPLHAL